MKSSADLIATLKYKTTEQGGRITPAISGYRPQLKFDFDEMQTSGQQIFINKELVFPGETVDAEIRMIAVEHFANKLTEGMKFEFREGSKIIGTGEIKTIINCKLKKVFSFLAFMTISICSCQQGHYDDRLRLGKSYAEEELKIALTNKNEANYPDNKTILIKDSLAAIKIAEPILFGIYGEKEITAQRPYEVYLIKNHWVLSGTISKNKLGGTFLFMINSMDGKVLKIIHGK